MEKLMKDKRALQFKSAFLAVLAVGLVITAIGSWINVWNESYNIGISYDLSEYDKTDNISSNVGNYQDKINVKSTNTGEDFEGTSIRGVFGILNNIYAPFRVVFGDNGILDSITERFGIPDYIRKFLVTAMIIAITFALVAILFRIPGGTS